MGPAVAAASTEHGHENMSMLNDVRKSDASQVVAARTDSFGRTNHACWEQAANDAAAQVESAQTTNVFGIVGTVITTAFDDNAAPGDAADTSGTNAEGAAQCAPMGLALRLRGGGDDFAAVFQDHENKLFPVSLPSGHVINNYAQFESFLWTQLSRFGAQIWQLPVTLRDGRTTTLQKLQEHMAICDKAAAEAELRARREAAAREAEAEVRAQREAAAREAAAREAAAEAEMQNHKSKSQIKSQIHKSQSPRHLHHLALLELHGLRPLREGLEEHVEPPQLAEAAAEAEMRAQREAAARNATREAELHEAESHGATPTTALLRLLGLETFLLRAAIACSLLVTPLLPTRQLEQLLRTLAPPPLLEQLGARRDRFFLLSRVRRVRRL